MSTKQPRLNVVLEPSIYETLYKLSKKEGVSMSLVARDLLREALTIHEDTFWAKEADLNMAVKEGKKVSIELLG